MKNTDRPIGIFDSGIGGLTVANAISRVLPNEQLVYYGDTEHMPYGEKSKELIREFSLKISKFLIEQKKCKAIVIACNTASAAAYEEIRDANKNSIPIINVIDPMVEFVIAQPKYQKVGIIATRGTIDSHIYQEKFTRRKPDLNYAALATPLLASMIEEGFIEDKISRAVLYEYLSDKSLHDIDALILACTHYPLIKNEIDEFFGRKIDILSSADVVAEKLLKILEIEQLLSSHKKAPDEFLVSDLTPQFERSTMLFYGEKRTLEELKLM